MKKKLLSLLLTGALCLSLSAPALAVGLENFQKTNAYTAGQFTDVPAGEWYAANVQAAYELGLMEGSSATTFNPYGNLTIAEALVLACRLHSTYVGDGAAFVGSGGAWYQPYVDYAIQNGILAAGTYSDYTSTATRAQFASILAAALPAEALTAINSVTTLPDVAVDASYTPAVLSLYNAGVLTGSDSAGSFKPDTTIQRSEVATIVTRMADPSLRKTFTLTQEENTGTGTQPSSSTRTLNSMTVTAEDLQGIWYAHRDPATTSTVAFMQVNAEEEWIFDGDQCTYVRHSLDSDSYIYRTGTFTVSSAPSSSDPNVCTFSVTVQYGTCYQNDPGMGFEVNQFYTGETYTETFTTDLRANYDHFYYDGSPFARADAKPVYLAFQSAFSAVGTREEGETDPAVYDFLASYIQREGHEVTFGDYAGQYECYLDLYQTLGTNKDWMYSVYYDPDADCITLAGSFHSIWGDGFYSHGADCTLTLTPDLTPPYVVAYDTYNSSGGMLPDTSATAYLDPDNFTDHTESVAFESYEGYDDSDSLTFDQENCAVNLGIMLIALNRDILSPNGHSLYGLGFDELSMY